MFIGCQLCTEFFSDVLFLFQPDCPEGWVLLFLIYRQGTKAQNVPEIRQLGTSRASLSKPKILIA